MKYPNPIPTILLAGIVLPLALAHAQTPSPEAPPSPPGITLAGNRAAAGMQTVVFGKTGLPEQIVLKAAESELPLELRTGDEEPAASQLQWLGRGPRLVAPVRLQALVEDQPVDAEVVAAAAPAMEDGIATARSKLKVGPYTVELTSIYRANGELQIDIDAAGGTNESSLRLLIEPMDPTTLACPNLPDTAPGAIAPAELNPLLPQTEGVVWDSAEKMPGGVRQLYVGNADAGFTFLAVDLPEMAEETSRVVLERDELRRIKWYTTLLAGKKGKASMALRIHPLRPRTAEARQKAWLDWPDDLQPLAVPIAGPALLQTQPEATKPSRTEFPGYLALAPYAQYGEMRGNAAADMLSHERDIIALYPMPLFRSLAGCPTGLTMRIRPNVRDLVAQYEPSMDRQVLGRALLHDIGVDAKGIAQPAEFLRVIKALQEFGFFKDDGLTEFIPYWRADVIMRYGDSFEPAGQFNLTTDNPSAGTYVSAYRRPYEKDGKHGVQVLFVVVNERDDPVRQRLSILDVERVFGKGRARPHGARILGDLDYGDVPEDSDWGAKAVNNRPAYHYLGLLDLEMRGFVRAASNKGQTAELYGPLFIPPKNFRLLWAYGLPGRKR